VGKVRPICKSVTVYWAAAFFVGITLIITGKRETPHRGVKCEMHDHDISVKHCTMRLDFELPK